MVLGEAFIRTIPPAAPSEMLLAGVEALLVDDGFQIRSTLSQGALSTAESFLSWSKVNDTEFTSFSTDIVHDLEAVFSRVPSTLRLKVQREKMWGYYHTVRSSVHYRQKWCRALEKIPGCESSPIFYQYITDNIFRQLVKIRFPLSTGIPSTHQHGTDLSEGCWGEPTQESGHPQMSAASPKPSLGYRSTTK